MLKRFVLLGLSAIVLSGCGSAGAPVPPQGKRSPKFHETYVSDRPYQVAYKHVLERCLGWTPGRVRITGRQFIHHEVFSDLGEAVIAKSLNEDAPTVVGWKIDFIANESGGCTIEVVAVNGDYWRAANALVLGLVKRPLDAITGEPTESKPMGSASGM